MMTRSRRTIARAVLGSWAWMGLAADPAGAETPGRAAPDGHGIEAVSPGVTALAEATLSSACPGQLSCGTDCIAEFVTGFCATLITWEVQLSIAGLEIGPSFRLECHYCDCWYIAAGPSGQIFKRHYDLGCGASFPGLEHE